MALSDEMKAQLKAQGFTDAQIAAMDAAGATGPSGPKAPPKPTDYPSIYSTTQANAKISDVFLKLFKRQPTKEELNTLRPLLIKAQKNNPVKQRYTTVNGVRVQTTTGGLDEDQWLYEKLTADPNYIEEINKLQLTPAEVSQRVDDKKLYEDALKAAGNDQKKIDQLNKTSSYGLAISGLRNRISFAADKAGAAIDETQIDALAKEAYDNNQDVDSYTFQKFLDNKLKFGTTNLRGEAAKNVNELRATAFANGIDLDRVFGSRLPTWLEDLNKGADVESYKKLIRDVAKIGMPEKVAKLMDQGMDLDAIYSPYQSLMENVLEVPRGSVTLDDPTLRAAITAEGEIPLYQFERDLRKDARWQFTKQAKEEVSSAVLGILRDFGFQG